MNYSKISNSSFQRSGTEEYVKIAAQDIFLLAAY